MTLPTTSEKALAPRTIAARRRVRYVFDRATGSLLTVLLSPWLLRRAFLAQRRFDRIFDREPVNGEHGERVELRRFAGLSRGRDLALLLDVAAGRLAWVGPAAEPWPTVTDPAPSQTASQAASHAASHAASRLESQPASQTASQTTTAGVRPGLMCRTRLQRLTGTCYEEELDEHEPTLGEALAITARYLIARMMAPAYGARQPDHFKLLGVQIDNHSVDSALALIGSRASASQPTSLAFVNPDCLNIATGDADYTASLDTMDAVFADGIGLQMAGRMLGIHLRANVNGTDLLPLLCERCVENGHSLYLLGGREGVADTAATRLLERYPTLKISGTEHGYFSADEEPAVIERINASKADILLVAFGAPRQESWITQHGDELQVPVRIGVGGLFDFYAGRVSRAPRWLRDLGLEWTWRLLQEPRRMWQRYIIGNPLFLWRVAQQRRREPANRALDRFAGHDAGSLASVTRYRFIHVAGRAVVKLAQGSKRLVDICGALAALLALAPLFAIVAVAIRVESRGPVTFHQERIGRYGRPFTMYKFRSMGTDAETRKSELAAANEMDGGVLFKMRSDPRVTRVGRLIRKYSIDELPQLWNVLRGDMSLVGPRPPVPAEVDQYSLEHRRRLEVKPGITCLWQVSGRSEIAFEQQVDLDVDYIESRGVIADIKILLKTIPAVLSGKGAY